MNETLTLGYALCGSFCTFEKSLQALEVLAGRYANIIPIFSEASATLDTRFGRATEHIARAEQICGRPALRSLTDAEPIGPKKLLDLLIVAPCTGNTLAKLALGITDTPVLMAAKAHLRGGKPLVLAVSTNDALGAASRNIGELLCRRDVFFVPFAQDDPVKKPRSMVALMERIPDTLEKALEGEQIQPLVP